MRLFSVDLRKTNARSSWFAWVAECRNASVTIFATIFLGNQRYYALELRLQREHGADRNASALAAMTLDEVLDAGVRWSVVGKRGAPVSITPQLVGLLDRLDSSEKDSSGAAVLEGTEDPEAANGRVIFSSGGALHAYRGPESVADVYRSLSFVDRPTLDSAIDAVVGDGPDSEEMATWLERDFEALTARYEVAASRDLGLHYRYS